MRGEDGVRASGDDGEEGAREAEEDIGKERSEACRLYYKYRGFDTEATLVTLARRLHLIITSSSCSVFSPHFNGEDYGPVDHYDQNIMEHEEFYILLHSSCPG